ncbi:alpha-amylase family glycosyl hydrolase [Tenacibaculum sp. SG-28]|uniref:alpha-amylase family glycosyl hydrolase n=1 Tax=Tenacibaculum sp. SG-28 TaxID=754426 RepID=UPI000CF40911|nr:alpha-amylase family glycosyl hydrolase [Tenacibaculum sp. SG-28]PQJ23297.1 alpha-amlyase [Tenacibaculum sp. SG-28]
MKKTIFIFYVLCIAIACKKNPATATKFDQKEGLIYTEKALETAVIYEVNIRQYSEEGTFDQFTKDIPQLKELGVKILWVMPIFPISEIKRKATGDKFVTDFPEEERDTYLGSYYAVKDFKKINPEFGSIEDFRKLVDTAHENGMYVILDWVPNHTGWDHHWITENPDFYSKNAKGEITDPLNEDGTPVGWQDVADLNYDNQDLRKTMIEDMLHWITKENIDGFRCDVAGSVPTDFWQQAIPELRAKKDIFMLAEAWEPELLKEELFDMAYGWDKHHVMNAIAKGEENALAWDKAFTKDSLRYEKNDILMNFVTNHDENSWNGTIAERLGESWEVFTALSYVAPGMPLIYSGQEYDLNHRLKFFEKDVIPHQKGKTWELLKKLAKLKIENTALNGGKEAADYERLNSKENVLIFQRKKDTDEVIFMANLSVNPIEQQLNLNNSFTDYLSGESITTTENVFSLGPWEYRILVK